MNRFCQVGLVLVMLGSWLPITARPAGATDPTVQQVIDADDETTCRDGIGWTYDGETILASDNSPELARAFLAKHDSCLSGAVSIHAECSPDTVLPERNALWVICLVWFYHELGGERLLVQPEDFQLIASKDYRWDAQTDPSVYEGQRDDITGGVYLIGDGGRFGLLAFAIPETGVETPMLLFWETTGDVLIVDVREPEIGRKFVERDW
jgi:hypothetical protein